jgi:hypothetical protein
MAAELDVRVAGLDRPHHHLASIDADPRFHGKVAALTQFYRVAPQILLHSQRRVERTLGMVFVRDRRALRKSLGFLDAMRRTSWGQGIGAGREFGCAPALKCGASVSSTAKLVDRMWWLIGGLQIRSRSWPSVAKLNTRFGRRNRGFCPPAED